MKYVLAVDGGGTKTHVWCADENGNIIGDAIAGPTNLTAVTKEEAAVHLVDAITHAIAPLRTLSENDVVIKKMVMGLAGVDTPHDIEVARAFFSQLLTSFHISEITVVNDIVIAQHSGTDKPDSIVLIAGTGSNCFGKNSKGEEVKVGGVDYLLADQGSGYWIGTQVLKEAVKSFDQIIPHSLLEDLVCTHFQIQTISELKDKVYQPPLKKTEVAELSKLCAEAAEKGDEAAKKILEKASEDLFEMISTVTKRLDLENKECDCIMVGSVTKDALIKVKLLHQLKLHFPQMNIVFPEKPPVYGALKLALH
jgi:N-acetylglucosamine kinase-like BadF-type ATPase